MTNRLDKPDRPPSQPDSAGNESASDDDFWRTRFHWCALAAGFLAASEGRLHDSRYVQRLANEFYESGAFRDRLPPR